jgi:GH35 family endo-1,4-beta-xylanase
MNDEGRQTSLLKTIEAICQYAKDPANGIWIDNVRNIASYVDQQRLDESIAKNRKGEIIVRARPGAKVTVEQLSHEFWFGCAISNSLASGSMSESDLKQYKEKFLQNFNSAVTENAVKWYSMEPRKGEVNYAIVDGILKWTEENHIPLRGHNLFWGIPKFVQQWIKELNDDELRQTLQNRAETVTRRYKGRFAEYDLNNEMIHGNYYEDRLGPEITKLMAQWAHNGDPGAKLFVNDYDILTGNRLADYMAHIRKLLKEGVPIAGIGVQGHLHAETFDRNQLKNALDSLAVFKLPIRITEFNMPGQRSKYYNDRTLVLTQQDEDLKAKEIVDYYRICFAHPAVEGILMWGFWEGANWIPVSSLYKRDWTPTPAAEAYHNLIFRQWWTKESWSTGSNGTFSTPAFYGKYKVTVDGVSKEIELNKEKGTTMVDFRK